jgi:phosphoglycolate phosphatase
MTLRIPALVLCDLDGTLVDTVPDISQAADNMMLQLGLPPRGEAAVRTWIGNGIESLVKRALLGQMAGEPDEALFQRAFPLFKQAYAACNGQHSVLFSGVREGLTWLKAQDFALGCITNKSEQFTLPLLASLELENYFSLVISGDTLPKKKPDPLPLLYSAEFFKVNPRQALMIGDSINDVQAARAAGFQIICVPYGYNHGEDIRLAKPDAVIESLAMLPEVFD